MGRLVVLPALIPDIRAVYDTYFAAFRGKSILRLLFPSDDVDSDAFRESHTKHTLAYWHTSGTQYTVKCVDEATGEIVGMALWDVFLKERTPEERANPGIPWLQGEDRARAEELTAPFAEMKEKLWGGRRYIYFHLLAVKPEHQKRGAGALLTQWGLDMADQAGLPVYTESSADAVRLYTKLGFETLKGEGEKIVHRAALVGEDKDVEVPLMVRMPSVAKGLGFDEWRAKGFPPFE